MPSSTVACVVSLAEKSVGILEALKSTQLFAAKVAQQIAILEVGTMLDVTKQWCVEGDGRRRNDRSISCCSITS